MRIAGMHYQHAMERASRLLEKENHNSYDESLSLILSQRFIYSDAFSRSMSSLGYSVREVIWDFEPLQKQWAKESGFREQRLDVSLYSGSD